MCENHKRTYGIELEGYTTTDIRGDYVQGWNLTDDGSLDDEDNECSYCDGRGISEYECSNCNGYGTTECESCCGGGEVPCSKCECTGQIWDDELDEYIECDECDGSAYVKCKDCEGEGRTECETCEGNGRIEEDCCECGGDGSYGDSQYGVECVSNVCEEGNFESIDKIFDYIDNFGWYTNNDCGTHVHIGGSDLMAEDLSKLAILCNIVEPMIYGTQPDNRLCGTYAKKTNKNMVEYFIDTADDITLQEVADYYYGYDVDLDRRFQKYESQRYHGLNLHSWFYRGTIEFRYFKGCEDKEEAIAYIELCVKLVDFAKHATFEQLKVIGNEFYNTVNCNEFTGKVKTLLDLEYNFRVESRYSFETCKNNIASQLADTTEYRNIV